MPWVIFMTRMVFLVLLVCTIVIVTVSVCCVVFLLTIAQETRSLFDMACYHPSFAVVCTDHYKTHERGELVQRVVFIDGLKYDHMLAHPFEYVDEYTGVLLRPIKLPCGKCVGCQLAWSQQWAARMTCESFDYPEALCWFITLTYEDSFLPIGTHYYHGDLLTSLVEAPSCRKQDISDFMTDVRMDWYNLYRETGIRFFGATEYGEKSMRPHAHLIVYNLDLRDLDEVGKSFCGDTYYRSKRLEEIWGKGFIAIAPFDYKTAAYTARYCVKKSGKKFMPRPGETMEAERAVMSRRPGIGAEFARQNFKKIYTDRDELTYDHWELDGVRDYIQMENGLRVPPPRYFDKLYQREGTVESANLAIIKMAREDKGRRSLLRQLAATQYTEDKLLRISEDKAKAVVSKLARELDRELCRNL